jgi:cytoskeletal protein CcmA (bactofilin family)
MFTTKPESGEKITKLSLGAGDAKTPFTESKLGGGAGDAKTPFTERPATYASKSLGQTASKMVPSIIGEDLTIRGNVASKGEIQVDGEVEGDIRCGSLLLGDKSKVTGGVAAEDVVVRGHIVGSVRGVRITLQGQSVVEGDIFYQSLAIEQGASFEGTSRRTENPLEEIKAPAANSSANSESTSVGSASIASPVAAE